MSGSALKELSIGVLRKIPVPIPPLPEQKKIAQILTTWDTAIEKTEQLLQQLQLRKKGLMQQLLSGNKRLKGFVGEWEEVKLRDVASYRRGSFPQPYGLSKWYDDENGYPFIQVYDVGFDMKLKPTTKRKISKEATKASVFTEKGTILITIQGSIGRVALTQYDAYVDRTLLVFQSFKKPIEKKFFIHILHDLFEIEKRIAPGGTIKTITKEKLSNFKIILPSKKEQTAIATILTQADTEIEKTKTYLTHLQTQKKGLMQQLLTGQKRVTIN